MEQKTLSIPNISCGHCVNSIKEELKEIEGVTTVNGDPQKKTITVEWHTPASLNAIQAKLQEINYPATA